MRELVDKLQPELIGSVVAGNAHTVLSRIEHPVPAQNLAPAQSDAHLARSALLVEVNCDETALDDGTD